MAAVLYYRGAGRLREVGLSGAPEDGVHPHRLRPGRPVRSRASLPQARPPAGGLRATASSSVPCAIPWDYYVSLWSFGGGGRAACTGGSRSAISGGPGARLPRLAPLLAELRKPTADWQSTYAEPHTPERFRSWLSRVHDARRAGQIEAPYGASELRHVAGYATYRYCRLYSGELDIGAPRHHPGGTPLDGGRQLAAGRLHPDGAPGRRSTRRRAPSGLPGRRRPGTGRPRAHRDSP